MKHYWTLFRKDVEHWGNLPGKHKLNYALLATLLLNALLLVLAPPIAGDVGAVLLTLAVTAFFAKLVLDRAHWTYAALALICIVLLVALAATGALLSLRSAATLLVLALSYSLLRN